MFALSGRQRAEAEFPDARSLAKQIFQGLTRLIAYQSWLDSRVELAGGLRGDVGGAVSSSGGEGYPKLLGWPLEVVGGLGRCFPQLPASSRCFQMLPANDVEQALAGTGIIPPCASSCQPLPASGGRP